MVRSKCRNNFSPKCLSFLLVVHCIKNILGIICHSLLYFAILTCMNGLYIAGVGKLVRHRAQNNSPLDGGPEHLIIRDLLESFSTTST